MKAKFAIVVITLLLCGSLVFGEDNNGAGCGMGKLILDGKSGKGAHLGAWVINALVGIIIPTHETSAMSSGTSGCDTDQVIMKEYEQEIFVATNYSNISYDMARGDGQYLKALHSLMGCDSSTINAFSLLSQERYNVLIPEEPITVETWIIGLKREMAARPGLSAGCTRVS